jgi:acyl carrier protein
MMDSEYSNISNIIKKEIEKYYDEKFNENSDFISDMNIASDDLSAIALSLERKFGIKISEIEYRNIVNVQSYAQIILAHLRL